MMTIGFYLVAALADALCFYAGDFVLAAIIAATLLSCIVLDLRAWRRL